MESFDLPNDSLSRRLDSWKEIAAFFGRDERTVRRWEKERSLPIHRVPGKPRSGVYAFKGELTLWLKTPEVLRSEPPKVTTRRLPEPKAEATAFPVIVTAVENARLSRNTAGLLVVAAATVVALGLAAFRIAHSRNEIGSSSRPGTHLVNAQASDLYLKGRYEWSKRSPESLNKAAEYFTQAIGHDPNYAEAYAGLADTYNLLREYTTMADRDAYPRALAAARKAIELDDSLSQAHRTLAFATFWWTWDFTGALREFKRAIELNPNDPVAHHWYATSLLSLRRFPEALSEIEYARQLDPTSTSILADKGLVLFAAGRPEESIPLLKQVEAADPSFLQSHNYLAYIALASKDYPAYLAESRKAAELKNDQVHLQIANVAEKGFAQGGEPGLLEAARKAMERYVEQGLGSGYELAQFLAMSGHNQEAIRYLQHELENHEPSILGIPGDFCLNSLHSDPNYDDLVSRIGLPHALN